MSQLIKLSWRDFGPYNIGVVGHTSYGQGTLQEIKDRKLN